MSLEHLLHKYKILHFWRNEIQRQSTYLIILLYHLYCEIMLCFQILKCLLQVHKADYKMQ